MSKQLNLPLLSAVSSITIDLVLELPSTYTFTFPIEYNKTIRRKEDYEIGEQLEFIF